MVRLIAITLDCFKLNFDSSRSHSGKLKKYLKNSQNIALNEKSTAEWVVCIYFSWKKIEIALKMRLFYSYCPSCDIFCSSRFQIMFKYYFWSVYDQNAGQWIFLLVDFKWSVIRWNPIHARLFSTKLTVLKFQASVCLVALLHLRILFGIP